MTRLSRVVVAMVICIAAVPAQAQEAVHGRVTDAQGIPISGAMVVILMDGSPVARQLTDAAGDYTAGLPSPGPYRLRVERIGYRSTEVDPFEVAAGASVRVDVRADVQAVVLRGIDVTGMGRCSVDPRQGAATAVVWEEARKALEAARWTQDREMYRFLWSRHIRNLDASGRVRGEDRDLRRGYAAQPFQALSPDTLAEHGFVRERDGEVVFFAPDAEVLLSDAFLESHCFGLREMTADGERRIGLTFEPVPWRTLPEVRGALWLDAEGARLRSIEYQYLNHRTLEVNGQDAHGALSFRGLPNGTWIVDAWSITMPRLTEVRDRDARPMRYDVRGHVEEGGVVTGVQRLDGTFVLRVGQAGIGGVVTDSLNQPVVGARVQVEGTVHETISGEEGSFRIGDLGQGTWSLRVTDAALSSWGHPGTVVEATAQIPDPAQVHARLPSLGSWAQELCELIPPDGTAHLLGRIVGEAGESGIDDRGTRATVRLGWSERVRGVTTMQGAGVKASDDGRFHVCAVPTGRPLFVDARADGAEGHTEIVVPTGAEAATVEVLVASVGEAPDPGPEAPAAEPSGGRVSVWIDSTGFLLRAERALFHAGPLELARARPDSLTALLMQILRVEVHEPGAGPTEFRLHPSAGWASAEGVDQSCVLDTYLNGSQLRQRIFGIQELEWHRMIEPRYLSAIEVYQGAEAPVGSVDSCGAILLWVERLRDRDDPAFQGRIEGRIRSDDTFPAEGVPVRLFPGGQEARTDANGNFVFEAVLPAFYTLEVMVPEWGASSLELEVRAGAMTTANLTTTEPR